MHTPTDLWYNNALIYALNVEVYMDGNGDGIGDFEGLVSKLDYLSGLGINCIWIRPFFPSPLVDDGYDVQDYYTIDSRLGTFGDFADFITKADAMGIRVIIDIIANHTSDQHKWFQKARKDKNSRYRNYYIWSEKPVKENKQQNLLNEEGVWNYDEVAGEYYLHHFFKEEPDLNISNPEVRKEIKKIMGFWLQMGVSGFRVDAAHVLYKRIGSSKPEQEKIRGILDKMREFVKQRNNEAILLAEANVKVEDLNQFFENGGGRDLVFNFITNKNLFLAMARENPAPLIAALKDLKKIKGQWVNFLRNHDELNLEMLSEKELKEVFEAFAPDENMRIFGHGIRRRLPPMLNGNRKKLELIYTVMFSLPGIPLINYGEEITMGDDLNEKGRLSVRTVMQWNKSKNAGFAKVPSISINHSIISKGKYNFRKINVADQQRDRDSFLNWMEKLITTRKQCPQLSYGQWELLESDSKNVLSFYCESEEDVILVISNFKNKECIMKLNNENDKFKNLIEIFSNREYEKIENLSERIQLDPFGYRWFKCSLCVVE